MMMSKEIYFICTGNSCRSQIAEGFADKYFGSDWEIKSADIEQHGVNPLAIKAMDEVGIDISNHTSDLIDNDYLQECTFAVTLCGDAKDRCPVTPASVKRIHWPLEDPAQATGTEEQKMTSFREVRDKIDGLVQELAENI